MDLAGFVSLKDDCSRDRNLEAARFILRMKDGETKLTVLYTHVHVCQKSDFSERVTAFVCFQAPNLESRELWKGFLYSVIDVNTLFFAHFLWLSCIHVNDFTPLCSSLTSHPASRCCPASCRC